MNAPIEFTVHGRPAQMGSKRAFVRHGRAVMVNDNSERLKQWYNAVASKAAEVMAERTLLTGPIHLSMTFYFKRPKGHYGSGKNSQTLKPSAPYWHTQKPDLDKVVRCTCDAMSTVVWRDDSQICLMGTIARCWADGKGERAEIRVNEIGYFDSD